MKPSERSRLVPIGLLVAAAATAIGSAFAAVHDHSDPRTFGESAMAGINYSLVPHLVGALLYFGLLRFLRLGPVAAAACLPLLSAAYVPWFLAFGGDPVGLLAYETPLWMICYLWVVVEWRLARRRAQAARRRHAVR